MRDDSLLRYPFPRRNPRSELKPCGPECRLIWHWGAAEVVHALGHTLEDALRRQTLKRGPGHAGKFCLSAGQEPPLVLGDLRESAQCGVACHRCILSH